MSKYLEVILNELVISMTLLLSASLVNCFLIITIGTFKVGKFYFYSRVFSHTKFHSKLRDSQYLLSDALLYVFPVKNISNANSRFPILYSTKLPPEGEASVPELQNSMEEIRSGMMKQSFVY